MKTVRLTTAVKATFLVAAIIAFTINTNAQTVKNLNPIFTKNAIASIIVGIQSDVAGIQKECIYMAGMYKLDETVDALISQLAKEQNPRIRVQISVALLKIGEERGIKAVYKASLFETDPHTSYMFKAVVYEFYNNRNQKLSMK
jgi:hypothetical protein